MTLHVEGVPNLVALLAPLSLGIAWFIPALATLVSNAFGAFAQRKARNEQQRQIDQKWQQYQTDWSKWRDDQNTRNEALSKYITDKGWDERLGDLKTKITAPIVGNAPGGSAPRVSGSFFNDFLGSTAAALPQLMATFGSRGGFPASTGGQVAQAALGAAGSGFRPISPSNRLPFEVGPGGSNPSGAYPTPTTWPTMEARPYADDGLDAYLESIYGSGFRG